VGEEVLGSWHLQMVQVMIYKKSQETPWLREICQYWSYLLVPSLVVDFVVGNRVAGRE
jgi:hypothetical protein